MTVLKVINLITFKFIEKAVIWQINTYKVKIQVLNKNM